ncbi:MAG: zinc ribbon domain-containing protein [Bacilli bacterium]|nr:zinc ribbon domain-containing protein [Bacilli bacterium]
MENKICQSCSIPITSNEQLGTNKDGSINMDYCKYCYESGEFVNKVTMEEYIDICSKYSSQTGVTYEEMKEHCSTIFPTLKRWKCTCTDECARGYNINCTCENPECHCTQK